MKREIRKGFRYLGISALFLLSLSLGGCGSSTPGGTGGGTTPTEVSSVSALNQTAEAIPSAEALTLTTTIPEN